MRLGFLLACGLVAAALAQPLMSSSARGEPGAAVNHLMAEPTSLFSFGMLRLGNLLDTMDGNGVRHEARYDWDRNRITIFVLS